MGGRRVPIRFVKEIAAGQIDPGGFQSLDFLFPGPQLLADSIRHGGVVDLLFQLFPEGQPQALLLPAWIPGQEGLHRQGWQVGPARLQEGPPQPGSQPVELFLQVLDLAGDGPVLLQLPGSPDGQVQLLAALPGAL